MSQESTNYTTMTPCTSRGKLPAYAYLLELGVAAYVMSLSEFGIYAGLLIVGHSLYRLTSRDFFQGACPNCKAVKNQIKENGKSYKCKSCKHQIGIYGLKLVDLTEDDIPKEALQEMASIKEKENDKKEANHKVGGFIIAAALIGFIFWVFGTGSGLNSPIMSKIEQDVAADAVKQYGIANRNGNKMDKCVQAGFVTAAYLQANDEANYAHWKTVRDNDCKRAGVPLN